jgi:hypothetical protein
MNAWIATFVAFMNWRRLNFISVTSSVPPSTSTSEGAFTNAATEPPSTIAVPTTMQTPTRPISVAGSTPIPFDSCWLARRSH